MSFAENTRVPVDRTQSEIKRLVQQHGATAYGAAEDSKRAMIWFEMRGRQVRFHLPLPIAAEVVARGKRASEEQLGQELRRRWRALLLIIKAKIEGVESKIRTFEQEFLADIVMPNGQTIGEWSTPQIEAAYSDGKMPPMLPGAGESSLS